MPALEGAQLEQAAAVLEALRAYILECGGWIPFDKYLDLVLYAPGLGYYSAGAAKLGRAGDFTTAPEVSPMFGACIARQCACLTREGGEVLELGAGSGALAEAMLLRLQAAGALPERYLILEVSADLRDRQRARLSGLAPALYERVRWLDSLPQVPIRGVILANEVADALPFQCFAANAESYEERGVSMDEGGHLGWAMAPCISGIARRDCASGSIHGASLCARVPKRVVPARRALDGRPRIGARGRRRSAL